MLSRTAESRTLTTDRDYLEKSILEPNADIVEGFPPAMPPYAGSIPAEDMTGILDYLMDSKGSEEHRLNLHQRKSRPLNQLSNRNLQRKRLTNR